MSVTYKNDPEDITLIGKTNSKGKRLAFGIKEKDRSKHVYIIGKTGMGKSTLLEQLVVQDLKKGNGLIFIDPHGTSAEKILKYVPKERINDVVYFAPHDIDRPISLNVMENVSFDKRHLVVSALMDSFRKLWGEESWSDRMAHILNNTLLGLLEYPKSTLLDIGRMYSNAKFREEVVENIKDPQVKAFWTDEYARYTDRYRDEATPAIQNKIGQLTSNPIIRNILGRSESTVDVREVMDSGKVMIVNLSKGRIGETNASIIGNILTTKIYLSALERADVGYEKIKEIPACNFYVDEFQSVATNSFEGILSEARKYKLQLVLAHQYVEQIPEEIRNAVFGNVGTFISFRIGALDAEVVEKVFGSVIQQDDFINLGLGNVYLSLMIDGIGSRPFSANTVDLAPPEENNHAEDVVKHSREVYGVDKDKVEREVAEKIEFWGEKLSNGKNGNNSNKQNNYNNNSNNQNSNFKSNNNSYKQNNNNYKHNIKSNNLDNNKNVVVKEKKNIKNLIDEMMSEKKEVDLKDIVKQVKE